MNVLHVIPSLATSDGGTREAAIRMCESLSTIPGLTVAMATTRSAADAGVSPHTPRLAVHVFPRTASQAWKYSRPLGVWLRARAGDYDVIHAHAAFTYSTLAARRAAARCDVPLVITPHGMLSGYSRRHKPLRKIVYWQLVEKHNLSAAACLHATTEAEREELRELTRGRRAECVHLGVDANAWETPRRDDEFRRRYRIPPGRPLVLYLSRLHSKKGLADVLLPAVASLADVHLAVVGGDDPSDAGYGPAARAAADRLGLGPRVTFTGPLYGDDKWAAYDAADLYVLPSRHENFGITVAEAMARGVPCLVTPGVQSAGFVEQAGAGTVVARDAGAIGDAIAKMLSLPRSERTEMGQRGRQFAQDQLNWPRIAAQMADLYASLRR